MNRGLMTLGVFLLALSFCLFIISFLQFEFNYFAPLNYWKNGEAYFRLQDKQKVVSMITMICSFLAGYFLLYRTNRAMKKNKLIWVPIGIEILYLFLEISNYHFYPEIMCNIGIAQAYNDYYDLILLVSFIVFLHLLSFAFWNNKIVNYVFGVIFVLLGLFGGLYLISLTGYFVPMILLPVGILLLYSQLFRFQNSLKT